MTSLFSLLGPAPSLQILDIQLFMYQGIFLPKYLCTKVFGYTCTKVFGYSCTKICMYWGIHIPRYSCAKVFMYQDIHLPGYSCTKIYMYQGTTTLKNRIRRYAFSVIHVPCLLMLLMYKFVSVSVVFKPCTIP